MYNFDEKCFLAGISRFKKRVVALGQLLTKQLLGSSQDGSREFITLIVSICADSTCLPPALIYKSESGEIVDTWLNNFNHGKHEAYFAASDKGWSNESIGLHWLEHVFDRHTKAKAQRDRRLLIVDGHNSHLNMKFINYADRNRISTTASNASIAATLCWPICASRNVLLESD